MHACVYVGVVVQCFVAGSGQVGWGTQPPVRAPA